MKNSIAVDYETCIKCSKCVRICPAGIFVQKVAGEEVYVQHADTCIQCGHCTGVCPTRSVVHSAFPPEKVHPIKPNMLPTPEQVLHLIRARRSNRAFSAKPVPGELLDQIVEAAHRAPTASNMQQVSFTLVTNPDLLNQIIDLTIDTFVQQARKLQNPLLKPILKRIKPELYKFVGLVGRLQEARRAGEDPILRKATALLLIHTPKSSRFGQADANLAYQNGSLMAESMGVSQVYTGFLCTALGLDPNRRINKLVGIEGIIHAGMALGMPSFRFENYIDKENTHLKRYL